LFLIYKTIPVTRQNLNVISEGAKDPTPIKLHKQHQCKIQEPLMESIMHGPADKISTMCLKLSTNQCGWILDNFELISDTAQADIVNIPTTQHKPHWNLESGAT
jgi:hypothetical protein